MNKKYISIGIIILLLTSGLLFITQTELRLNMENSLVYVNDPYNPNHANYGEDISIPWVIEHVDQRVNWRLDVTLEDNVGNEYTDSVTGGDTTGNPLDSGPLYVVTNNFGGTWNKIGTWHVTDLELWADSRTSTTMELIDWNNDNEEFAVKYFPSIDMEIKAHHSGTTTFEHETDFEDGDDLWISYTVENTGSTTHTCGIRIYIDENNNGELDGGEHEYLNTGIVDFAPSYTHCEGIPPPAGCMLQEVVDYDLSNEGVLILGIEAHGYSEETHDGWFNTHCTISIGAPLVEYTLTTSVLDDTGTILDRDITPSDGSYTEDTEITLTPEITGFETPPFWNFDYWSGDVPIGEEFTNPLTIIMDSNKDIVANYKWDSTPLPDSDNDGVPDINDICPGHDDNIDSDNDGIPDGCDSTPLPPPIEIPWDYIIPILIVVSFITIAWFTPVFIWSKIIIIVIGIIIAMFLLVIFLGYLDIPYITEFFNNLW